MKTHVFLAALALLCSGAAIAQYRYVAPDGTVTFSDTPPVDASTQLSIKDLPVQPRMIAAASLPYSLTQASSRYPVVIYTAAKCGGCDSARAYLKQRGVPFTEKTVSTDADVAALKKISGGSDTVPLITVGSQKTIGFLQSTVSSLLDDAGYPASSVLPRDYTYPAPVGLTGPSAPAPVTSNNSAAPAAPVNTAPAPIPEAPAPTGNAPPGFKF